MRIVHLLKHGSRGNGSVHVAVDLACAQVERGDDVWFVSARGSYDDLLRSKGVRVWPVREPTDLWSAALSMGQQLRLALKVRPHIVHAHMMSSAITGAVVACLAGSVLVTTMHNSFDGHSWIMRLGKRVVAVSEAEKEHLVLRRFPKKRLAVVLNGTLGSPREELPFDDIGPLRRPSVMTLSGLHPRKAVDDVITAFAGVARDFPDWHLNVAGSGPYEGELQQQVEDLGLTGSVHFIGSTLTPMPLLRQTEIFAHAALADPCPLAVIEARVAGCAIVATRVGGIPEILANGVAGQLVDPRAPADLEGAMRGLMADSTALSDWRAAASRGSDFFSTTRMAAGYNDVYLTVARKSGQKKSI